MIPKKSRSNTKSWRVTTLLVTAVLLLAGCTEVKVGKDPFFEEWRTKVESSRPYTPEAEPRKVDLPERIDEEMVIEAIKEIPRPLPTIKVTMTMRDTDVNVVLRALARIGDVNLMVNQEVSGITNINVIDTPWDQVFTAVLRTRGLSYAWSGDIIRVMSLADMDHDRQIEQSKRQQVAEALEIKKVETLLMRIIRIFYKDAANLKPAADQLLTREKTGTDGLQEIIRGSITVDEQNNALIIHAIRDDIAKIITLIESLDRPSEQVFIEAFIVETTRDVARQLGVQWGGLYHNTSGGDNYWITPGANTGNAMGSNITTGLNPTTGMAANFPVQLEDDIGLTLGFMSESLDDYLLNVQLTALEEANKINILSNPSITTLDNQVAMIESGAKIPFQTVDDQGQLVTEFEDAVLKLEVLPHIINKNVLKLKITTTKDEVDFSRTVLGNPTIIKKRAQTNLILHDGQTTVIGGLTKETSSGIDQATPGLKDVPYLGRLFRAESKSNQMEEVLIFITPHIIKEKTPAMKTD